MKVLTFWEGEWVEGNPSIMGPMTHAVWMASAVFDGARYFEGVTPDLGAHCARVVESAKAFGINPCHRAEEIEEIARDGIARFPKEAALYLRPMMWPESGFVAPDPDSARFCFTIHEQPMPSADGFAACLSSYLRPLPSMAPTLAKAACLYPNSARALVEAQQRGFDNGVVRDGLGNVAEFATANLWIAKDGAAHTPIANGTFLSGITRTRVAQLLQKAGVPVFERTITWDEVLDADEVFSTGNLGKVLPVTKVEDRSLQPGPIFQKARELYWDWAHQ